MVPLHEALTPDVTFLKMDCEGSEIKILAEDPDTHLWRNVRRVFVEVSAKRIRLNGAGWHAFGRILKNMAALGFDFCKCDTNRIWKPDFWSMHATKFEVNRDIMVYFYASGHDPHGEDRCNNMSETQKACFIEWLTFSEVMDTKSCLCRTCKSNG